MSDDRFDFESLRVYRKAIEYVDFVYQLTKNFPREELFSLTDQFKRAAVSICLNIAEGSGGTKADLKRFLTIAKRSVRECVACTEISLRQAFLDNRKDEESRNYCVGLSMVLNGLIKSLDKVSHNE